MAQATIFDTGVSLDATGFLAGFRRRLQDYRLYRRTVTELNSLSARELADLNIGRSDIPALARTAVYGA